VLEISGDDMRKVFDVNLMEVWNCYTLAAKQMISQRPVPKGSTGYEILGAASIVASKSSPMLSWCSASKWAVRIFTQVFDMEMARHSITVDAYAPGIAGTATWGLVDEKLGQIEGRTKSASLVKYSKEMDDSFRQSQLSRRCFEIGRRLSLL
jgi:NAD(P)-dependent dehydrogenase (short-subunit alcohol dehydrogenase family)